MAHRFFVAPDAIRGRAVTFPASQAHQLREVLRMQAGAEIWVLDNRGSEYRVRLEHVSKENVRGAVVEQRPARGEPQTEIVLYQALLKADKFEWVLQKGTEVGISEFVPVATERTVADRVSQSKLRRWTQIVTEAAEQAGRAKIPVLAPLRTWQEALADAAGRGGALIVPYEGAADEDLASALAAVGALPIQLMVGPEGGFSQGEIHAAAAQGAHIVTLGPRILRAETAGLVAASAILYARGDLSRA